MAEIRRYCGIAEESSFGVSPAPAAVVHLDIASSSLDVPSDTNMFYEGGAQRGARIYRPGYYSPAGNIVYGLDVNTIGWFLKWVLGGYAFTSLGGSAGRHLHEMYGSTSVFLPSFCARVGKDLFEHVFHGCIANSLSVNVGDSLCIATVEIQAKKDSKADLELGELLFPDEYPLAFHEITAYLVGEGIGNSDLQISAKVKELTLEINNNAAADQGRHIGSRYPSKIPANDRETTMAMNLFFEDIDMLEKYWGAELGPSDCGSTEYAIKLVMDTAPCAAHGSIIIDLPRVVNSGLQQQPSGRSELVQTVSIRALTDTITLDDDSTIESEILCTVENNVDDMDSLGT